jgi:hypothetical protein
MAWTASLLFLLRFDILHIFVNLFIHFELLSLFSIFKIQLLVPQRVPPPSVPPIPNLLDLAQPSIILVDVLDQILNRTSLDPPLLPKSETVISPHHVPAFKRRHALDNFAVGDQLAYDAHGLLPC